MKQISTGAGLVALSVGMIATAFVATHRSSGEAFAQGTGGERRIVFANVLSQGSSLIAYRIWSDNSIDTRLLGGFGTGTVLCTNRYTGQPEGSNYAKWLPVSFTPSDRCSVPPTTPADLALGWITVDNGTSGFRPITDVDMSGETDAGDISQVLMDFNTRSDDLPPPPIDCTINAPR